MWEVLVDGEGQDECNSGNWDSDPCEMDLVHQISRAFELIQDQYVRVKWPFIFVTCQWMSYR